MRLLLLLAGLPLARPQPRRTINDIVSSGKRRYSINDVVSRKRSTGRPRVGIASEINTARNHSVGISINDDIDPLFRSGTNLTDQFC